MRHIFTLLAILAGTVISARDFTIERLGSNQGLSNSSVTSILQDSSERLWFGSWDGLNLYNSQSMKVFKPELGHDNSISNNIIREIAEQRPGIVWIATDNGINRYDCDQREFRHYFYSTQDSGVTSENAFHIAISPDGSVFASVQGQGLFKYDGGSDSFRAMYRHQFNANNIRKMLFSSDNTLWALHNNGRLSGVEVNELNAKELPVRFENASNIFYDAASNQLWIVSSENGKLVSYSTDSGESREYSLPLTGFTSAMVFRPDNILIGGDYGLKQVEADGDALGCVDLIDDIHVLSLLDGTQGILWIGTDMQGVWKLSTRSNQFNCFPPKGESAFDNSAVRDFAKDKRGRLWVATKGSGIYIMSGDGGQRVLSHVTSSDGLINNAVFTLDEGKDELWIGTDGEGINYYDYSRDRLYALDFKGISKPGSIYSIYQEGNVLWVGTSGRGVFKITVNRSTQPYSVSEVSNYSHIMGRNSLAFNIVYNIIPQGKDTLLIGTRGRGVDIFDKNSKRFTPMSSLPGAALLANADVLSLLTAQDKALWIGTSLGLYKYDAESGLTSYTERNGMPNNTIHGIVEDKDSDIWVSTNKGLVRLVSEDDSYRIVSFFEEDGLQENEFSDGACYKDGERLYFGGIRGFNSFRTGDISSSAHIPSLLFTGFYIDNEEKRLAEYVRPDRHGKNILRLTHLNRSFSFHFVPVDYVSGSKCDIAYRMSGWQNEWIEIGPSGSIVLSNITPGNYTLEVRCCNADKLWSEDIFVQDIHISPAWYKSSPAMLVYVIVCLGILFIIRRSFRRRREVQEMIRKEEEDKQRMAEMQEAKLSFFTDIAHEFSNTLTLIYGPCEKLLQDPGIAPSTRKYINVISANSDRMQILMQQLLDFRKAESGHLALSIEPVNISSLIMEEADSYREILENRRIKLNVDFSPEQLTWNSDRSSIEKIIFNLLSNAVKYTPQGESISIAAYISGNEFHLKVKNTGVGISEEYRNSVFDKFEVVRRVEKALAKGGYRSTGLGLALCKRLSEALGGTISIDSDSDSYTCFSVDLPYQETSAKPYDESGKKKAGEPIREISERDILVNEFASSISDKSHTALIVDDDKDVRDFIRDNISGTFNIMEATNGREALDIISHDTPDIVISDVMMPEMDGLTMAGEIKKNESSKHIPVILLSAKATTESQIAGLEGGADAYVPKPFNPRYLISVIDSLMRREQNILDYGKSAQAAIRQFQGSLVKKEDRDFILSITSVILKNINNGRLTVALIASETSISENQLYRRVKALLQMSPIEYIESLRMQRAAELLRSTNMGISEIMYECGFTGKGWFFKKFSATHGCTPGEYRKRQNEA